ncbi:MAG: bifunctional diaminohydroxyphosphoribosylaminopyrimidine deaminase/5-amino-6-(5-phosphoribosylamino)uracil reductase RibD [Actinomycetota bacterium]|nr:bifunctional diaminohydroxyphosphoribosylaminopyrimidine deaminase/5-amino-6-(5-phosphoribosylamino)uracil reductase RibD [Actinomycetota bacterium]
MICEKFMRRAIELAEGGRGKTNPNPLVGAVLVRDGEIIGEGYHEKVGGPHAEINALMDAGDVRGANLYVTLEPCCIQGRTPPCTKALIEAGISEAIIGMVDPNPKVSGRGIEELEKAGVEVASGVLEGEVRKQNEVYIKYVLTGRPFVLMKVAMSLNGKIAEKRGRRTIITGQEAQARVHSLRSQFDAVMVGSGTVLADDPELTVRMVEGKNPIRLIVSTGASIPLGANVVKTARQVPTILATTREVPENTAEVLRAAGVEVLILGSPDVSGVDLFELMDELGRRRISSVILEGGACLNTSMLEAGLVDKFLFFIAPKVLIGEGALDFMEWNHCTSNPDFEIASVERVGADLMIEAYPTKRSETIGNR